MCLAGDSLVRALHSLQLVSFCQNEGQNSATGLIWQEDMVRVLFLDMHVQFLGKNISESWSAWTACLSVLESPGWVTASSEWGESHEFIREAVTVAEGFRAEATWG